MTFLLNLMSFFTVFGMIIFFVLCMILIDALKYKLLKNNRRVYRYTRRR